MNKRAILTSNYIDTLSNLRDLLFESTNKRFVPLVDSLIESSTKYDINQIQKYLSIWQKNKFPELDEYKILDEVMSSTESYIRSMKLINV